MSTLCQGPKGDRGLDGEDGKRGLTGNPGPQVCY